MHECREISPGVWEVYKVEVIASCTDGAVAQEVADALNRLNGIKTRVDTVKGKLVPLVTSAEDGLLSDLRVRMSQARNHEDRMVHHSGPGWIAFIVQHDGSKFSHWVRYVPGGKEVQTTTKRKRT